MIEEFDLDMDGEISEQEFIKCVSCFPIRFARSIPVLELIRHFCRIMSDDV